jgi:hypothetical protein
VQDRVIAADGNGSVQWPTLFVDAVVTVDPDAGAAIIAASGASPG